MTAAAGILHEEFHSEAFAGKGGDFEMVQLWVNLPAAHKMATPGYQAIANGAIPVVSLADDAGTVRAIAGEFGGQAGPAPILLPDSLGRALEAGRYKALCRSRRLENGP